MSARKPSKPGSSNELSATTASFLHRAAVPRPRLAIAFVLLSVVLPWVFHAAATPVAGQEGVLRFPENPPSRLGTSITYSILGAEITEVSDEIVEPSHQGLYHREFQRTSHGVRTGSERVVLNGVIRAQHVETVRGITISLDCGPIRDRIVEEGLVLSTLEYPFGLSVSCPTNEPVTIFIGVWLFHAEDDREGFRIGGMLSPDLDSAPAPAPGVLAPCKAVIDLPAGLKPGEVLSPSYTITAADGRPPHGDVYPVLYINGRQANSVVWDGKEAKVELQVSCQGHALSVSAIMPAYGSPPPPADTTPPDGYDSVPDGLSKIPLPENASQAMAGIVIPGIISVILGILGQSGAAVAPSGVPGAPKVKAGSAYDFGDGRDYYEGQSYTFDDGKKYEIVNGEFVPTTGLRDGEVYTDPDGNRKIWVGGQAWHESDWRRQAAANRDYRAAHDADWAIESTQLNPDMVASQQQYELETAAISHLGRMQHASVRHGMATEGAVDDMFGRAGELLEQIRNGEQVDYDRIARIRSYIGNRISGFTPGPGDYPPPEESWWADGGAWAEGFAETGRNLSKAQNSDGSTSWVGLGGRLAVGALTGGASEWVFVPMASTYTMKDAIDSGSSGLGAAVWGIGTAVVQDAIGRGINVGISGAVGAYQGGAAGAWQGVRSAAADQVRQAGDLLSGKAWQATGQRMVDSVSNGSKRFADLVSGREGYTGPGVKELKKGIQKSADRILGKQPKLNAAEQAKLKQFNDAIHSGDPKKVAELYRDGGMKKLSELQRKGVISPEKARKCNSMLKTQVDDSIREGTRNSIIDVQNQTQVRVKEVIVADSGSSAKSQVTRLNTDADRTLIPTFNESDLMKYANRNNLTRTEAYNDLCRKLNEAHTSNVGQSLKGKGLTTKDVDFGSYDRIGSASGQADSYPTSFTNARTGVDGTAEVTRVSADGNRISQPYKTSGQTAVDANQLNTRSYGTGRFDADPTRILPADTKPVLDQQIKSIFDGGKTGNPEALAKSVERFHKQASIGQHSTLIRDPQIGRLPDQVAVASRNSLNQASDRMITTSRLIRNVKTDPSQISEIARQNGYGSVDEFMQECIEFLKHAEAEFSVVP